jgi:uncharacterized protein YecE (DUF72 family)
MTARGLVKVGLCGYSMAAEAYYARYPVVEVQQTFYRPPRLETLGRWRRQAPPPFEFTLKAWQLVTHDGDSPTYRRLGRPLTAQERAEAGSFRDTPTVRGAWRTSLACAAALRARQMLLQCPARFRPTDENAGRMRELLRAADRGGLRLLWEPRGRWPPDLVRELCQDLDLVHVVDPFDGETVTPERVYYRLHGRGSSRYVYTEEDLARLARQLPPTGVAYVLFNNLPRVGDAARFVEMLR